MRGLMSKKVAFIYDSVIYDSGPGTTGEKAREVEAAMAMTAARVQGRPIAEVIAQFLTGRKAEA